jgi:glyoxylase-like metal-dependent hydrolase (beta-lactamase superfamily II)
MILFQNTSLTVYQSVLYQTNSSIITLDKSVIVVDPTWLPSEIQEIKDYIAKEHADKTLYIFFTHSDYDHILAFNAFPNATTIASKAFVERTDQEQILEQIRKFDDEYYIQRPYPITYPFIDIVIDQSPQSITIENVQLDFYKAAGHTSCGLFLVLPEHGIWIAGDYLSDIEFPFIYDSFDAYNETIRTAYQISEQYHIKVLIPGHGKPCLNKEEIKQRIYESEAYLKDIAQVKEEDLTANTEKWTNRYPFPKGLVKSHLDNWKLIHQNSSNN